jgi:dipeptidyl aminopeptidase/acylaminoacyl peptidase
MGERDGEMNTRVRPMKHRIPVGTAVHLFLAALAASPAIAQEQRPLAFVDLMRFRQIENPSISPDGRWIAFTAEPDRGDPEVIVRSTPGEVRYVVPHGSHPVISADGRWVAARLNPPLEEQERTKGSGDSPGRGLALHRTGTEVLMRATDVQDFAFSADGRWLAYLHFEAEEEEAAETGGEVTGATPGAEAEAESQEKGKRKPGARMVLGQLRQGDLEGAGGQHVLSFAFQDAIEIENVRTFAFDHSGRYVAYARADLGSERDGLYMRDLRADGAPERAMDMRPFGHYGELTWSETTGSLAFVLAVEDEDGEPGDGALWIWDGSAAREAVGVEDAPDGWMIPADNSLRWTRDGQRLFFGYRPSGSDGDEARGAMPEEAGSEEGRGAEDETPFDPYDVDALLVGRQVDVWHWQDPRVNPQQKVMWPREKDRTYAAVYHLDGSGVIALAGPDLPEVGVPENGRYALARSDVPYRREATWMGDQEDLYVVRLGDGARTKVAERLRDRAELSPGGRFVVFYAAGDWHLYDVDGATTRNLTGSLGVPFANEDHDYPEPPPGYGVGGWVGEDAAVLLYDKYDIWHMPTDGTPPSNMTGGEGRLEKRIFRVIRTDPEKETFEEGEEILLSSYHDLRKDFGFYSARAGSEGVERLLEEEKRFHFVAKAEEADIYLYTREAYDEFPDLWVADSRFRDARKLTDVNPQIAEFAWGSAELTEWESLDGIRLQGVVIKPGHYEPGRRYPVLVYFYRFFSQRLHEFNEPVVNHRPSFPLYASNGYVVFLPDVRFEVGRPGLSAMKSVVPGVKHLIDVGLADPGAIGLHGHSWSGYTTSYIVTQTNLFAAAVAGAPVSNMTSAYSGIRWESGRPRQFQYEMEQSRLRGSLWEAPMDYIQNSPVFFADRVETPILLMHGDEDGAVPWYQSIEYYLALRRNDKEAVFLQYRGEPHHLQEYPNKLDYSIKMKEWFDHYLKAKPAPDWITRGEPYGGK